MTSIIKDDLLQLKDKLENIEKDFQTRLSEVEEKQKKYKEIDEKFQEMAKEKDFLIKINVGGKIFIVKLSTITAEKDTLFYKLFATYLDKDGDIPREYFFDRNYTHFPLVLEYLRNKKVSLKNYNKFEKEEIIDELDYFGIDLFKKGKKVEIDIEWDQNLSKSGACTVDTTDKRNVRIHSNTCYTHFLTNRTFSGSENFVIEFDSKVTQTDNYYYIGIANESYSTTGNCGCCNPANYFYLQCDGSVHINSTRTTPNNFAWYGANVVIGMRVMLSEKQIYFYKDSPDNETGPYMLTGNTFRVMAGHCNSGNGSITITTCYEV